MVTSGGSCYWFRYQQKSTHTGFGRFLGQAGGRVSIYISSACSFTLKKAFYMFSGSFKLNIILLPNKTENFSYILPNKRPDNIVTWLSHFNIAAIIFFMLICISRDKNIFSQKILWTCNTTTKKKNPTHLLLCSD